MDRSQDALSAIDELRRIRQDTRQTKSLDKLRRQFDRLVFLRRVHVEDFDMQIAIAELHQEIIERARYLSGDGSVPVQPSLEDYARFFSSERFPPAKETGEEKPAAEIPPEVPRLDVKSWQMIVGLALFLTLLVLAAFFYLIQTARKINFKEEQAAAPQQAVSQAKPSAIPVKMAEGVSVKPTVRLYTDLIPGTVTIDDQPPQDLKDGELVLDNLQKGEHSIKVAGHSGLAAFRFSIKGEGAPQVLGVPEASNAMAVLVSEQDGHGRLVTNAEHATVLLDANPVGEAGSEGLALDTLGAADHDLAVEEDHDRQRFVLTYTPAPVLTVYVKSDPSVGTVTVMTGEDGVDVYINETLYARKTEHGQLRIPLRVGDYRIRVHKTGFIDPPALPVAIKKAEESAVEFHLLAAPELAALQIKGAPPGTSVYVDDKLSGVTGADGFAKISNLKTGDHAIELRHDQFQAKKLQHTFHAGDVFVLSGLDVVMEKAADNKTPAQPAPASNNSASSTAAEATAQPESAASDGAPMPGVAAAAVSVPGEEVRRGGGFVSYHVPKTSGHYSFQAQGRIGGFLKHSKLQWYAGYQDASNYVLFSLDGKHATLREVRDGISIELKRIPFEADSNRWVQVDLSVKPDSIGARVKTGGGAWNDIGSASSAGRDFTQGNVGFFIPDKDEVAIANFRFSN